MRILVDENIPRITADRLRELGHDVKDIRGTSQEGVADSDLWNIAAGDGRLLISTDKGFTGYRGSSHGGILVVRLRQPNRLRIHRAVLHAISCFDELDWPDRLVVVRDNTMSTSRRASSPGDE